MEGGFLGIGVFNMADVGEELYRVGGRFGLEEVDERLLTEASETGDVDQFVEYWLVNKDLASMNRVGSWCVR